MSQQLEIKVPTLGESVTEATVARWLKEIGEPVKADEPLVELETDKVTLEVPAPSSGVLESIFSNRGSAVKIGGVLGMVRAVEVQMTSVKPKIQENPFPTPQPKHTETKPSIPHSTSLPVSPSIPAPASVHDFSSSLLEYPPSVQKLLNDYNLDPSLIMPTGKGGRLTKGDILDYLEQNPRLEIPSQNLSSQPDLEVKEWNYEEETVTESSDERLEKRIPLSRLRQRVAERLKDAQNTAAILTTFNEVDMSAVMDLRARYKDVFEKKHGVKLGFMSFFVKACVHALKEIPMMNSQIEGDEIVHKNYYDIGIAVSAPQGLVVPVLRDADHLSYAQVEKTITALGQKAKENKLEMTDLSGGTFTISNGGIFGSLLSTPILNPPQSGILGMHKIQDRPVVVNGKIEIRPMMYLALSYDHRLIDGREAVTFLVQIKECIENPGRFLLNL
ncbi:MAG: 2-oxoglutarate dehydrogenase complex dihydrolipoyllysine-residue succinyltransferase [Alphaproteobacteria bacterium]|nr:2-oxoglutarate dehydrogenase complex dihydrolipoyllysine-residue succinyltransferase [Alphaproteobacteria bacterium]